MRTCGSEAHRAADDLLHDLVGPGVDLLHPGIGPLPGDGVLRHVAVANFSAEAETVWVNDGAGSFNPHPSIPSFGAGESYGVALGDIDGDGDLDALIANYATEAETVWLNDVFEVRSTIPSGNGAVIARDGGIRAPFVGEDTQA